MNVSEYKSLKAGDKIYFFDELDDGCPPVVVHELTLSEPPISDLLSVEPFTLRGKTHNTIIADNCYLKEQDAWERAKNVFQYRLTHTNSSWLTHKDKRLLDYASYRFREATKGKREEGKLVFWEVVRRGNGYETYRDFESGVVLDESDGCWLVELKDGSVKRVLKDHSYTTRELRDEIADLKETIDGLMEDL